MEQHRFAQIREIFLLACEAPEDQHASLLAQHCGEDASLRREVETLLACRDEPEAAEPGPGDVLADRYRVLELVGRGGMGEVYRVEDLHLSVPVALKWLRRSSAIQVDRLRSEVRMARSVTHPAVCRVHDVGEHRGRAFLTMEYVAGDSLAGLLRKAGRLGHERTRELAIDLCGGLAAIHEAGVRGIQMQSSQRPIPTMPSIESNA